jgi:hypothetical protein
MDNECEESAIAKFYDGRSIFITGATGFMGKVSTTAVKVNEDRESGSACACNSLWEGKWVSESENAVHNKPVRKREDI